MSFQFSIKKENLTKCRVIGKVGEKGLKDGNFEQTIFNHPTGISFLTNKPIGFICDHYNNCIRMIDFGTERVLTIAGNNNGIESHQDGDSQNSFFCNPNNLCIHKNQNLLFVSDKFNHVIRQIDISSLHHQQHQNNQKSNSKCLLKAVDYNSFNANEFGFIVSTICGKPQQYGFADGIGNEAKLKEPTGLAFSELDENVLYFCDSLNFCIRKVNILTKQVSTIAGNPNQRGLKDGIGNEAQFSSPRGICVFKNEDLFVCDYRIHSIRKISFNSNQTQASQSHQIIVSTIFGNSIDQGIKDGNKSIANLKYPSSILYERISNSLIFTQDHSIRQIKLGKSFLEWKLMKLFFIYRLLLKQCEKSISKRILLQLVSIQMLQISSSSNEENKSNNNNKNDQYQKEITNKRNKIIIEKQNKILEYIKSTNSNLQNNTSKHNLFQILF